MREFFVTQATPKPISFGTQGENNAQKLIFSLPDFLQSEIQESGVLELILSMPNREETIREPLACSGNYAEFIIKSTHTATAGNGEMQLVYTQGSQTEKSIPIAFKVCRAVPLA